MKGIIKVMLCGILAATAILGGCSKGNGNDGGGPSYKERDMTYAPVYDAVTYPDTLWTAEPVYEYAPELDRTSDEIPADEGVIKGLWLRSDYDGKESYAFGYLGIPTGATKDNKYPAVLLVHGGGGTAYWQWVKEWVSRGFVALALDMEGHVPTKAGTVNDHPNQLYTTSQYTTPKNSNYGDADNNPIEKTWMYYATSTAIRGNTLLHHLEFVDEYKVGVCGISWGGVITSIITGYDDRFAFSIPIYCSLNIYGSGGNLSTYYNNHYKAMVWDDDMGIAERTTPIQFILLDSDKSATPDSVSYTYGRCQNARITILRGNLHSHGHALTYYEAYEFASSIVNNKNLVTFNTQPTAMDETLTVTLPKGVTISKAYIATTEEDVTKIPSWRYRPLQVNKNTISVGFEFGADENVTNFYVCVVDSLGNTTSTKVVKVS